MPLVQQKRTSLQGILSTLMNYHDYGVREIARFCGTSATTISRLIQNDDANPTLQVLLKLTELFNISMDELVGLKPLMMPSATLTEVSLTKIPILESSHALSFVVSENLRQAECKNTLLTEIKVSSQAFAIAVNNNDWPSFPLGALMIVDPRHSIQCSDFVVVWNREEDTYSICKIFLDESDTVLKSSFHCKKWTTLLKYETIIGSILQIKLDF